MSPLYRLMSYEMLYGPPFRLSFHRGDAYWAASIQLSFRWRKRNYWHCWFFPWMP